MQRPGQFKMVLLGESGVGKSCLALRFAKGVYTANGEATIGAAFLAHTLQIDQETSLKVELWDTAGQERYHALAPMYYRGAQAALVVFDLTNTDSFRRAKMWVRELRQANTNSMVIGLAGSKSDLASSQRKIDSREAMDYAEENGLIFMETSSKTGDNVNEIFLAIAKQVAKTVLGDLSPRSPGLPSPKTSNSDGCCKGGK